MKRIITAALLVPLVLILVFLGPRWHVLFVAAIAVVAALAGWEFLGLTQMRGAKPPRIAVAVALVLLFAGNYEWPDFTPAIFGALNLCLLILCTFRGPVEQVMADASASIFCMFYLGSTMLALPALHDQANGPSLVAFLFCVVWAGDTAAYYVGSTFGRHKLAPRLSPGKSWEGSVGSVAGSLVAAGVLLVLAHYLQAHDSAVLSFPDETIYWMGLAVVVNVAAQVGDLVESAIKRSAGVKDSGSLLPGHGGVLDRIDALLLAGPALWYAQMLHQRF
jgi:phosphatidate cytidylyltransferase